MSPARVSSGEGTQPRLWSLSVQIQAERKQNYADLFARGLRVKRAGGGRSTSYDLSWPLS